jgi:thioesterase domain-containing protein
VRASVDTEGFARAPHDLHWGEIVTANLRIVEVPGRHRDLLRGPNLVHTASAVSNALTQAIES